MPTTNESQSTGDLSGSQWRSDPRVRLASERTLLAWVRTGLALMGFGFVVARFGLFLREMAAVGNHPAPTGHHGSLFLGVALAGMGVWVIVVAASRYRRYVAALSAGQDVPPPGALFGLSVAGVLAALGLFIVIYLLTFG